MNAPAFQFYVDDFLGGTQHFSDSERGLYITLLCEQWSNGSLPDDDDELKSYGKGGTPIHRIKLKFKKGADGRLRNSRMEIERKKQKAFRKSRKANGKLGGRPKKPTDNLVVLKSEAKKSSPISVSDLQSPKEGGGASLPLSPNPGDVLDAWNEKADNYKLPKCMVMSDKRRRNVMARFRDPFFVNNWRIALDKMTNSNFCKGANNRGWVADFDFFIQPDSVAKIIEGKYDNSAPLFATSHRPITTIADE